MAERYFSKRLPGVFTRAELVTVLIPVYAAVERVDDREARARLEAAFSSDPSLLDEVYLGLSAAFHEKKGSRTTEDGLMDKLDEGLQRRRWRVRPAPDSPGLAAVVVRINLAFGGAPEGMRRTLETDKGRALLAEGWKQVGLHLMKELLR